MKVFCAAFVCLQFGFVIFWQKDFGTKAAHKMLVKLTPKQWLYFLKKGGSSGQGRRARKAFSMGRVFEYYKCLILKTSESDTTTIYQQIGIVATEQN